VGEFDSGKTSSEHGASPVRGRAEALPWGHSTAAWKFPCSHTPDTAGAWTSDLAGISLAFMGKKSPGDALRVGEVQAGMWETMR